MDDLYSNLENYDDVNAVDELRNENRELKHKLEECSKTMNQLQKDFDKLHSEYKKLEINYSSLLKTARAEIERKTQLITNLNKEKDMIVIRAMQGGCRNVLQNVNKPFHNYKKNDTNKKDGGNKEILNKNKAGLSDNFREGSRESPMLLMKDKLSAPPANRSTSSERNVRQLDDAHSKENVSKTTQYQKHNIDKSKPRKISDRRKSMPVLSKAEESVCSDGEIMKDDLTRDHNIFQDYDNVSHNLQYLESRGRQRTNRFEQYNCDSRQTFNRGVDRHNPHHDKYNLYNQNYDNYSPERGRHHQYSESDYFNRSEYRHRVLESPPKDKYGRSKSRDRRPRSRDSRREYDYYNSRYEDHYDARSDIREPDPKRQRIDSADREQYAHEGRERYLQEVERRSYRPSEYRPDILSVDPHSCQSPDYDQIESNLSHHPIKEIKSTATVPLEDPRINSKKYSLKKSDQGIFISTVDKNTCMLPVNKTLWGFEKVEVPEALKANIWKEQTRDDIVNYIYTDIDDPANISSSKLCDKGKDSKIAETESIHNFDGQDRKEYIITDKIKQKLQKTNAPASKTILSGYKIPKQSKVDIKSKSSVQEKVINDGNTSNKNLALDDNKVNSNNLKTEVIDTIDKSKNQLVAPVEHNVEGDLELSDEESDITDELQITCKRNDNVSFSSYKNRDRDVENDRDFKKKYHKNVEARQNNKTNKEINEDVSPKNIKDVSESIKDSFEKDKKMQDNDDNEKPCEEVTSTNKSETCKKKSLKNKYDIESPENKNIKMTKKANESFITETKKTRKRDKTPEKKDTQIIKTTDESSRVEARKQKKSEKSTEKKDIEIIEKDNESFRIEAKETRKREKRNRLSSKDTVQEKHESKFLHVGTSDNMHQNNCENKPKDSKPHNKFTELFGDSSSLITPEDLNIPTKFNIGIEHNDNYGSLFENTQDAIDINVREIKEVSQTENNKIELLENVGTISNETDSPNIIHKKSLFEINDVPAVGDTFENLKTAVIDEDSNIVKTVVISSGIQPCLEENNTHVKNLTVANGNEVKEPEKVLKHQPLELLRAVATSTPHKMQHEQVSLSNAISTPNIENLDNDSNLSYSGSLTTTSNVEPNSDVPDVRIFIKRRRKIKK